MMLMTTTQEIENRDNLRLPCITKNLGKQKRKNNNYQGVKDWNNLDGSLRNSNSILILLKQYQY